MKISMMAPGAFAISIFFTLTNIGYADLSYRDRIRVRSRFNSTCQMWGEVPASCNYRNFIHIECMGFASQQASYPFYAARQSEARADYVLDHHNLCPTNCPVDTVIETNSRTRALRPQGGRWRRVTTKSFLLVCEKGGGEYSGSIPSPTTSGGFVGGNVSPQVIPDSGSGSSGSGGITSVPLGVLVNHGSGNSQTGSVQTGGGSLGGGSSSQGALTTSAGSTEPGGDTNVQSGALGNQSSGNVQFGSIQIAGEPAVGSRNEENGDQEDEENILELGSSAEASDQ